MRITGSAIVLLASLVVLTGILFAIAPALPDGYTHAVADAAILLALAVYALCWVGVLLAVTARQQVAAAWRTKLRPVLAASAVLVIGYMAWASWLIQAVLRSTDL